MPRLHILASGLSSTEENGKTAYYCKLKITSVRKGNGEDIAKQHEITDSMQPDDPQVNSASGVNVQPLTIKIWANHSKNDLHQVVNAVYEEIVFWRKNLFKLP